MQLAGMKCHVCGRGITFAGDAEGCHFCEIAFHNQCLGVPAECPRCHRSVAHLRHDRENNLSRTEKKILAKEGLLSLVAGGVIFTAGAGPMLWSILESPSLLESPTSGFIIMVVPIGIGSISMAWGLGTWLKCRDTERAAGQRKSDDLDKFKR